MRYWNGKTCRLLKLLRKSIQKDVAAISYDCQQQQQQQATNNTVSLTLAVIQPALFLQPPPIPFSTVQAYFGSRIDGSDSDFNGGSSMSSISIKCQPVNDMAANNNSGNSATAVANVTDTCCLANILHFNTKNQKNLA